MCINNYNKDLKAGDLAALKENVLADETFTFRHGELGVVSDFIPPLNCSFASGLSPHKVVLRMLKYGGYRVPVPIDWILKLDVVGPNGELIKYLQDLDAKRSQ